MTERTGQKQVESAPAGLTVYLGVALQLAFDELVGRVLPQASRELLQLTRQGVYRLAQLVNVNVY